MTNKVIIDYTQCKYYQKGECEAEIDYNGNYCDYTCESDVMNDCYYKQLQRKTQECEKMKEENQKYKSALEEIENKIISYCATTCIYGSSCYKECFILDIIAKAKEQE